MAEKIFTFDEAGMRTTIKGVRKALGMQGRPIPQLRGPRDGLAPQTEIVVFTIDSYDYEQGVALCTIEYRPYGMDSVTNEIAGYEQIEVQDPAGCYFNEAEADLIGRWGTAIYMTPSASADPYRLPIWVVVGLCCPAA